VGRNGPVSVSHLQFADDTLILGEKLWANVRAMRAVLILFDVAYLRISKVSIYISSPQGLVRYHGSFDFDYHFKLKE